MKQLLFCTLLSFAAAGVHASSCPNGEKADQLKQRISSYTPQIPSQGSCSGANAGCMDSAGVNAGNAQGAASACSATLTGFAKEAEELIKEYQSNPNCSQQRKTAEQAKKDAEKKAAECAKAGGDAGKQGDKNKDNKDKMGDGKDKGGGGGGPPSIPMPPQKKEKKEEDPAKKEQERQARIAACKSSVLTNLEIKKKNCESQFPFDPAHPVQDMKNKQDACKQEKIFHSQSELSQCEINGTYSPSAGGSSITTGSSTTVTSTVTSTATSTR